MSTIKTSITRFLFGGAVVLLVALSILFIQQNEKTNTEQASQPFNAQELLAASMQRTFQPTDVDDFRYQRIVHIRYQQLANPEVQELWTYKENFRRDNYFVPQYQSLMYVAKENSECQSVSEYNSLLPYYRYAVKSPAVCNSIDSAQSISSNFYEEYLQNVDRIERSDDPLSQSTETYEEEPAMRLLYRYKDRYAKKNETDEEYFFEFLILTEQQKIVEMVRADAAGTLISRTTITDDQIVLDKNPEEFFTTAAWNADMAALENSLSTLDADLNEDAAQANFSFGSLIASYVSEHSKEIAQDIADQKARKEKQYGKVVSVEGKQRYENDFYAFSFVLPPNDAWNATVNAIEQREMFEHELIQLYHPDPSGNEIFFYTGENVGSIRVKIITPELEEQYALYQTLLDTTQPRDSDTDTHGLKTEVAKETAVTIDGKTGKQYMLEMRTQTGEGDNTIQLLLALDDNTILSIVGNYGLGKNQVAMEQDILAVIDSLKLK